MSSEYNDCLSELSNVPIRGGYTKGNIERGFQKEMIAFLRNKGWYVHHIEDIGFSTRLLDLYCISPGGLQILVELKKTIGYTFNLSQFEPSQIELMLRLEGHGILYKVLIYSQKTNTYKVTTYRELINSMNEKNGIKLFSKE